MRFFLVDRVTLVEPGKRAQGIKCVSLSEQILHDHFPGLPVMPGTLITEGLAQLAGFLCEVTANGGEAPARRAVLVQIDRMKFSRPCVPGDAVVLEAELLSLQPEAAQVAVQASVSGETRATGRLTFALMRVDAPEVAEQRLSLYRLWTRDLADCPPLR